MKNAMLMLGLGLVMLTSCQPKANENQEATQEVVDGHNAKTSLDYAQSYQGMIPHFKGEVVSGVLTIKDEQHYTIKYGDPYAAVVSGTYEWTDGNHIKIKDIAATFKIEEGRVRVLPASGDKLANGKAEEVLSVVVAPTNASKFNGSVQGPEWYISEFNGNPVQAFESGKAFLLFSEDSRLGVFAGCNRMNGTYELVENKVVISRIASTMMACPDMKLESELGKALEGTFEYEIKGAELHLKQNNKTILVASYQ